MYKQMTKQTTIVVTGSLRVNDKRYVIHIHVLNDKQYLMTNTCGADPDQLASEAN